MFGFIIGTASLVGLITVLRRGRHGGFGGFGHRRSGGRRAWVLRWLFQRLDTTPGQEKVIQSAAQDLEDRVRQLYSEAEQLRRDLGKAMRAPTFDAAFIRESFARQRAHLETLEEAAVDHATKLHEALDERQRAWTAELLEDGPRAMKRCRGGHSRHGTWNYA